MLTKQQRAPLIKESVTGRHESVEIVRAKRCLFESSRPCASYYLHAKYLMTYLLLLRMLSTIYSLLECEILARVRLLFLGERIPALWFLL